MIVSTVEACEKSGMPVTHAACFQRVADQTNCVIASRSVGIFATGLILEGYASKGFHVKSKSCNWGPMAGFVLSDPRFTKTGSAREAREGQREEVQKALKSGATEIPLVISPDRVKELEKMGCMKRSGGTINDMIYEASGKDKKLMRFVLHREMYIKGAEGSQMWSVFYGRDEASLPSSPAAANKADKDKNAPLLPVMVLVDPLSALKNYRAAMTGDYDLWAVFPPVAGPGKHGTKKFINGKWVSIDERKVKGSERFARPISAYIEQEDEHLGNITARIVQIKDLLNGAIVASGYTGGNMVHHSDEVGRPKVHDVEMDYIAFIPRQSEARFIANMSDMARFMKEVVAGYHITFNPGWQRELGFSTTPKGSFEV